MSNVVDIKPNDTPEIAPVKQAEQDLVAVVMKLPITAEGAGISGFVDKFLIRAKLDALMAVVRAMNPELFDGMIEDEMLRELQIKREQVVNTTENARRVQVASKIEMPH